MLRYLYFKSRYNRYLTNEHGIKKFAEMSLGQLVRKVAKKSSFYREMNENMMVEKANLRMRVNELHENPMLDPGEYFSVRRRVLANTFIMISVVILSIFLIYLSISAFFGAEGTLTTVTNWIVSVLLAIILVGGGVIITERLIEALVPELRSHAETIREPVRSVAPLWAILLTGIELALLGLSEPRAGMFAELQDSSVLYIGFIIMSMTLPLMAGAIRWDAMRFIDLYKATQAYRQIEGRLAQIDSVLRQNEEYESNFYKIKSISYWDLVNDFKTLKDNYNAKKGITEDLKGHYSQTYDSYQAEANKRYAADIRDVTSRSIRKLELVGGDSGGKLSQAGQIPVVKRNDKNSNGSGSESYLNPLPIR